MDSLIPNMTLNPTPSIRGGVQPRGLLGDLVRPQGLNPLAVPDMPQGFNPGMTTMGLPQSGGRQTIASLSAGMPISSGAGAEMPAMPTGPTPNQVLAEQLPGTIQKAMSTFGGGESADVPAQKQAGEGDFMQKLGGAVKSFFDNPGTNLSSSSAVGKPAGDMSYQTPFFSTQSSRTSGPVGGENSNNLLERWTSWW